jgi:energy-dependent translational throttle protein EttA
MIAGELTASAGSIARSGGLGVIRQFIGSITDDRSLADLALPLAPPGVRTAGLRLAAAQQVPGSSMRGHPRRRLASRTSGCS